MSKERLQKVLAHAGVASRRTCETLISAGRVSVNGEIISTLGYKVDPQIDIIQVDGKKIETKRNEVTILYYKTVGVVSTVHDPQGRVTVVEAINYPERLYPVGRLDMDTSGLLLLTNDGQLAYKLTHPSHQINKTYLATVKGRVSRLDLKKLEKGVVLADGITAPARCRLCSMKNNTSVIEITIHEGRNRQVRRMFAHVGYPVIQLHRSRVGFMDLQGLLPGQWRLLNNQEIEQLKHS